MCGKAPPFRFAVFRFRRLRLLNERWQSPFELINTCRKGRAFPHIRRHSRFAFEASMSEISAATLRSLALAHRVVASKSYGTFKPPRSER
jgi:hypothetical protein